MARTNRSFIEGIRAICPTCHLPRHVRNAGGGRLRMLAHSAEGRRNRRYVTVACPVRDVDARPLVLKWIEQLAQKERGALAAVQQHEHILKAEREKLAKASSSLSNARSYAAAVGIRPEPLPASPAPSTRDDEP